MSEDRWGCLPAIRAAIAVELVKCGASQWKRRGCSRSHLRRYRSTCQGNAGDRIEFENDVKQSIELLAQDLRDGKKVNLVKRTCDICHQAA